MPTSQINRRFRALFSILFWSVALLIKSLLRYQAGFAVLAYRYENESCFRDFLFRGVDQAATPGFHAYRHRRATNRHQIRIQTDFVTDEYRMMKNHSVNGNGGAPASGSPGCRVCRRQIHLRHQPPPENVTGRVCISRHGNRSDHRFTLGRSERFLHICESNDTITIRRTK